MGKGSSNISELIDETIKKVALGLYITLNHESYYRYKKSFKMLAIEEPLVAYNLIKDSSSSSTAKLIFKIISRTLGFDSLKIDFIVDSLENGDEKPFKEMIASIQ